MIILSIVSVLVGLGGLFLTYLKFKANKPRLDVIKMLELAASDVIEDVGKLAFKFEEQDYSNLTAFEYLVLNGSIRSIEKEMIRDEAPIEISCEEGKFIDYKIYKHVGGSNVSIGASKHNENLELDVISIDRNASFRIRVLCDGKKPQVNFKGKLKGADRSVSIRKDVKGADLSETIIEALEIPNNGIKYGSILGVGFAILMFFALWADYNPMADIKPKPDFAFGEQADQLFDSILSAEDTLYLRQDSSHFVPVALSSDIIRANPDWSIDEDSLAQELKTQLELDGYYVDEFYSNYDYEENGYVKKEISGFEVYMKEISRADWNEIAVICASFFFGMILATVIVPSIVGFRVIAFFWRFRRHLSKDELEKINCKFVRFSPAKFFILFLPKLPNK